MGPLVTRCLYTVVFIAGYASFAFASPVNFKLLPLVPPGAEVVAGFQNGPGSHPAGRLLLTTHNNRLDLDDWTALTGVDSNETLDEVVEVASSSGVDGKLTEHLLLTAGHFDRGRIFRSIEQNGAEKVHYLGQIGLAIKPLAREQGDMVDTRWLVILNDRIGIFGTAPIVQEALRRYDGHFVPDPDLAQRLAQLHDDVTTWNVLASTARSDGGILFPQSHGVWTHLLQDADVFMVAARFAANIRIDIVIHVPNERESAYFEDKAGGFRDAFAPDPEGSQDPAQPFQPRLEDLQVGRDRVQASLLLSHHQFEDWKEREISRNRAYFHPAVSAHGD